MLIFKYVLTDNKALEIKMDSFTKTDGFLCSVQFVSHYVEFQEKKDLK